MNATVTQDNPAKKGLNDLFARLRANPRVPLIVAAAAVVAVVIAMVLWAKQPDYRVLFSNLSNEDGGTIVTQLTQMNVPYKFDDRGGALWFRRHRYMNCVCGWPHRGCLKVVLSALNCWTKKSLASASSASR